MLRVEIIYYSFCQVGVENTFLGEGESVEYDTRKVGFLMLASVCAKCLVFVICLFLDIFDVTHPVKVSLLIDITILRGRKGPGWRTLRFDCC